VRVKSSPAATRSAGLRRAARIGVERGEQQRRGFSGHARDARIMPVRTPFMAAGTTTVASTFHLGAPSASAPSRNAFGTVERNCSVVRIEMGISMMPSATAPARPEKLCSGTTTSAQAKMPITIEGTPFKQVRGVANREAHDLAAEFGQVDAAHETDWQTDQRRQPHHFRAAHDGVGHAAAVLAGRQGELGEKRPIQRFAAVIHQVAEDQETVSRR